MYFDKPILKIDNRVHFHMQSVQKIKKIIEEAGMSEADKDMIALLLEKMEQDMDVTNSQAYALYKDRAVPMIITMDGGLIHNIEHPTLHDVIIYDYDIESYDREDLSLSDKGEEVYRSVWNLNRRRGPNQDIMPEEEPDNDQIITNASKDYDWSYTRQVKTIGFTKKGEEIRQVSIPKDRSEMQRGRYASGLYFSFKIEEWEQNKDLYLKPPTYPPISEMERVSGFTQKEA